MQNKIVQPNRFRAGAEIRQNKELAHRTEVLVVQR
jgi:hypothetical protein